MFKLMPHKKIIVAMVGACIGLFVSQSSAQDVDDGLAALQKRRAGSFTEVQRCQAKQIYFKTKLAGTESQTGGVRDPKEEKAKRLQREVDTWEMGERMAAEEVVLLDRDLARATASVDSSKQDEELEASIEAIKLQAIRARSKGFAAQIRHAKAKVKQAQEKLVGVETTSVEPYAVKWFAEAAAWGTNLKLLEADAAKVASE